MAKVEYAENCEDLSSVQSYLFNFLCNRCGYGYQSTQVPANTSVAGGILKAASGLLYKGMGPATNNKMQQLIEGPAHERALQAAIVECRSNFKHCAKCGTWVGHLCCWNDENDCCKNCAPIPGEEEERAKRLQPREPIIADRIREEEAAAAAQALTAVPALPAALETKTNGNGTSATPEPTATEQALEAPAILSACPKCGTANVTKGKFCHECGTSLVPKTKCSECGSRLMPGAKFCPECGAKV